MSIKFILFSSNCNESGPFSEITPIAKKNSGGLLRLVSYSIQAQNKMADLCYYFYFSVLTTMKD